MTSAKSPRVKLQTSSAPIESKSLWITAEPPPQFVTLDFTQLRNRAEALNLFGLDCWHDYPTNPSLIELFVSEDSKKYSSLGQYPVESAPGWQYFKLPNIPFSKARFFKIVVVENHGGSNTYINQVMVGYEERGPKVFNARVQNQTEDPLGKFLPQPQKLTTSKSSRQKVASEHLKLTTTERELLKVTERVKHLEVQNGMLKSKMGRQGEVIEQLQSAIGMLVKNMEKLQGIVERNQRIYDSGGLEPSEMAKVLKDSVSEQRKNTKQPPEVSSYRIADPPQSSKPRMKSSTGTLNKPQQSFRQRNPKSRKDSRSSSDEESFLKKERLLQTDENKDVDIKRTKILPLLEQLQLKIAEKSKLQERLGSPYRRQQRGGDSDSSDQYY